MSKTTKIKLIKRILKVSIAGAVLVVLIVLGFFVKNTRTFENADMKKWLALTESQQIATLNRVVANFDNQTLLIKCVTKIAKLPDSDKMDIRDAIVICYNGIKINSVEYEK